MDLKINAKQNPKILHNFLYYLQVIKGYSLKTVNGYKLDLLQFFNFIKEYQKINIEINEFNIFILSQVATADVIAFLVYLNFSKDSSPYTRQRKLTAIRQFYRWLKYLYPKRIKMNPTHQIENILKVERLPKYLSLKQAKKVCNIFTIQNTNYPLRNNTIISLFICTGLRLNELINIKICDVDFSNNCIKVKGKGNKERIVYFNTSCKLKLQKYLYLRERKGQPIDIHSPLFLNNKGKKLGTDGIEYICHKAYKLAGLEQYKYNVHSLRHTAATIMYRYVTQDVLILKEFLGHKRISTTEIYTHTYNKQLVEAMKKHPLNCTQKIA